MCIYWFDLSVGYSFFSKIKWLRWTECHHHHQQNHKFFFFTFNQSINHWSKQTKFWFNFIRHPYSKMWIFFSLFFKVKNHRQSQLDNSMMYQERERENVRQFPLEILFLVGSMARIDDGFIFHFISFPVTVIE